MSTTLRNEWDEAFEAYNKLPKEIKLALRHNCADLMEQEQEDCDHTLPAHEGCEEIGSSDINHRLFDLYKQNGQSWQAVSNYLNNETKTKNWRHYSC